MPANSTHADYDAALPGWIRARDLLAGEDAVKAAGEKYLPRLDGQSAEDYEGYQARACFSNATRRAADAFVGMVFRKAPFVRLPEDGGQTSEVRNGSTSPNPLPGAERVTRRTASGIARAMQMFVNDADMLGTSLFSYAKNAVREVISVGRAGTLVDWEGDYEQRAYASAYRAEDILNWRVGRVNGRNVPVLITLGETANIEHPTSNIQHPTEKDEFETSVVEQIRVLRLVPGQDGGVFCRVDLWQERAAEGEKGKKGWVVVESRVPLRLGKPLPLIPFVFHGAFHSRPEVGWMPLADLMVLNLDHYRLDADYKHGLHYTALPTAWVAGMDKPATLTIGSKAAWTFEDADARAGFLEFRGDGLGSFERALERDERVMAVLGSQILENQERVAETATAIMLRQAGENSVLASLATSVSESLTQVMRWVYWWNSTESIPEMVTDGQVLLELNTEFGVSGMESGELAAVVNAWKDGAISQDTMLELFRKREMLPDGRSNKDEMALIAGGASRTGHQVAAEAGAGMGQEGVTPPLKIV